MSVLRAHKGWKAMCVTFDVSGWCSNSRNDTVASVVGLTLYKYYVQYSPFIWEVCICRADCGQHFSRKCRGTEGLDQYMWMDVYIAQMRKVLEGGL